MASLSEKKSAPAELQSIVFDVLITVLNNAKNQKDESESLKDLEKQHPKIFKQFSKASKVVEETLNARPNDEFLKSEFYQPLQEHFYAIAKLLETLKRYSSGYPYVLYPTTERIVSGYSESLLEVIHYCENKDYDLEWLRIILIPGGEIDQHFKEHHIELFSYFKLPIPSLDKNLPWHYKFKETLERSLFSPLIDKVVKKQTPEFKKEKKVFYSKLLDFQNELETFEFLHIKNYF